MRKFIIRGLIFTAIGLMLLCVLNLFYTRTNGYRSLNGTYKFSEVPENLDVVNLGSSHGEFGFDYGEIDTLTGFNLGLRGQSHYFDLQVLKKFSDRLAPGCIVIIPVSCYSMLKGIDPDQSILYYGVLDYASIPDQSPIDYVRFQLLPILSASFNAKYLINDKESVDADLFATAGPDLEFYRLNALYYYGLFEDLKQAGADSEDNKKILGEMIEYCRVNGYRPFLVTTPFTNQYNYWYTQEDYSEFYAAVDSITADYEVSYLDYSHDKRFGKEYELFADSDHLNPTGRRMFTRILLADIGAIEDAPSE